MLQSMTDISDYKKFISDFESGLKDIFKNHHQEVNNLTQRGFSKETLKAIMSFNPLSVSVPSEYGGRGMKVKECLGVLEAASYESLSLSLIFGINIALFLEPFAKYGQDSMKTHVFKKFIEEQGMGGLMISEPLHGSDALGMQTSHFLNGDDKYHLKGTKHWQGLTGMADFWLVASKERNAAGNLGRDISLFVTDQSKEGQKIEVAEYYENNGLYPIPYGKNSLDLNIPQSSKLVPESTGIKMLMDLLHRSRMQFPGMAMGFLKRIMHEANDYCNSRLVRGNSLLQFDQVQYQFSRLQHAFTVCSAMCHHSAQTSGYDVNLSLFGVEANTIKSYVTDLMQNAAQTLTQLMGSSGYKIESYGSRGIMDSRPFQIFEGPNEMLYSQISEAVSKQMLKQKCATLKEYLSSYELTKNGIKYFNDILDFGIERSMPQRKHVVIGQLVSRIICIDYVKKLADSGFNSELIENSIQNLIFEVKEFIASYQSENTVRPVEGFQENSSWKSLLA